MAVEIDPLPLPGLCRVRPRRHEDARGWFMESFHARDLAEAGITCSFVQDNHAYSRAAGTVRGLHFQIPPHAQDKLVRVVRGAILDVVVDIRHGSPTFGRHVVAPMQADGTQLFVPAGLAHGLVTLEPDTEVLYKVSAHYAPEHDRGIAWDDPDLAIAWPEIADPATLSGKDRQWPRLKDLPAHFTLEGSPA